MNNKIDIVIPWVNGNDPKWLAEKSKYSNNVGDKRNIRFRDWDNLRFVFRSIEENMPWINNIYFITWGHIPEWLNLGNKKLKLINHKDYIPEKYLPTFNSNVIELNLHRIRGLSENFIYINDDIFILRKTKSTDFFKNNLPVDCAIMSPAIMENKNGIGNTVLNNMGIINTYFHKNKQIKSKFSNWFNIRYEMKHQIKNIFLKPWNSFTGFYEFHGASCLKKSTFLDIWNRECDSIDKMCSESKFRNMQTNFNQWLIRDWQLASNMFIPGTTKLNKLYTLDNNTNIKKILNKNKSKVVCLNDSSEIDDNNFSRLKKELDEYFITIFPNKSSFEK